METNNIWAKVLSCSQLVYLRLMKKEKILTTSLGRTFLEQFEVFSSIKLHNMPTQKHLQGLPRWCSG